MYDNNIEYNLPDILRRNSYPGRGIVLGRTPDGVPIAVYFIMGRSENSRNRVFVADEDNLFIRINDPAKLDDPSLILYRPIRQLNNNLIVTNGDQTDTIYDVLSQGGMFQYALDTRKHEPDAPHYTPRISGLLPLDDESVLLSVLRAHDASGETCDRLTYSYELLPGEGRFVHTYQCDGNPLPSFVGEPARIKIPSDIKSFAQEIWKSLNADNKVALYVRKMDEDPLVYNRHAQGENQ
ncbi:MAG: inosine monophosphate cyclohydrolase [Christensenellaceae bacterium]|nr:inosine monophosphate cyclohydrolase [Christensenellaceae bacterium]